MRVASTVKDITELRQSQERERDLHVALQHRQKLEALGTLAGGIAHDMNNTLVPILALSKRGMTHALAGSRERQNFETIYPASEHARDLVKQILTFSRRDNVDKKPVRLGTIAREALQMMRAGIPTMIGLVEHIDEAPLVLGDAGQIRQVIINLGFKGRSSCIITNLIKWLDGNLASHNRLRVTSRVTNRKRRRPARSRRSRPSPRLGTGGAPAPRPVRRRAAARPSNARTVAQKRGTQA